MDNRPIDQIQCPKCGQYRMAKNQGFGVVPTILSILTLGLYAVAYAVWAAKVGDKTVRPGDHIKCLNCKATWVYEE